jgi:hypothetical protein
LKSWAEILSKEFSGKGLKIPTECDGDIIGTNSKCDDSRFVYFSYTLFYLLILILNSFKRMRQILGIKPIDIKKTLIDMANSFIKFGIVKLE